MMIKLKLCVLCCCRGTAGQLDIRSVNIIRYANDMQDYVVACTTCNNTIQQNETG